MGNNAVYKFRTAVKSNNIWFIYTIIPCIRYECEDISKLLTNISQKYTHKHMDVLYAYFDLTFFGFAQNEN